MVLEVLAMRVSQMTEARCQWGWRGQWRQSFCTKRSTAAHRAAAAAAGAPTEGRTSAMDETRGA